MKIHLKLKGKAMCGTKKQKHPLKFVTDMDAVSCGRCKRAAAK